MEIWRIKMHNFEGIITAIITPFTADGNIYEPGVENEIFYLKQNGIKNIFACGSYGAFPLLSNEQRFLLSELVIKSTKKHGMKTILQIGSPRTCDAIDFAKHAESIGADAISAVVPFYYSGSIYKESDFLAYYEEIINSVSIPVHCYNNPKTTGYNVTLELLGKLIDLGLGGIKDGGSDIARMLDILNMVKSKGVDFDYYPSSTNSLVTGFLMGAKSCISGVSVSVPSLIIDIYENVIDNNIQNAVSLYKKAMSVRSILGTKCGRAIAAYDVLHKKGIDIGTCKKPWRRLDKNDSEWLIQKLDQIEAI